MAWIFKPKTKKYKITFNVTAEGTMEIEREIPVKDDIGVCAISAIGYELAEVKYNTGIKFDYDLSSVEIKEVKDACDVQS